MYLSPLTWLLLALLALVAGRVAGLRGRKFLWTCTAAAAFSVFAMTPLFANLLVDWLEYYQPRPQFCKTDPPTTAVVLSGGLDRWPRNDRDFGAINIVSRRRAEKAIDWWRDQPGRELVFAGGTIRQGRLPESLLIANYAMQLGVDPSSVRVESGSRNTWENAQNLLAMRPQLPRRVELVTSAMHMRRAVYSMREAGFETCSLGADWRHVPAENLRALVPTTDAVLKSEMALHEIVGLVFYRWHAYQEPPAAGG
jgi:uncharacterized SAM-binding protein YcdF (DUF218 family)